jgi:hypothetical protein
VVTLHGVAKLGTSGRYLLADEQGVLHRAHGRGHLHRHAGGRLYRAAEEHGEPAHGIDAAPTATSGNTFTPQQDRQRSSTAAAKTFTFTAIRSDTQVAAEVENNAELEIEIVLRNSAVTY